MAVGDKLDVLCDIKLGWIAGILDGEGCLGIQKAKDNRVNKVHYAPNIRVSTTDKRMIEDLAYLTGLGKVHYVIRKIPGYTNLWKWSVYSTSDVFLLMLKLVPHLVTKKAQARVLLKYCLSKLSGVCDEEAYYLQMKALNQRGRKSNVK